MATLKPPVRIGVGGWVKRRFLRFRREILVVAYAVTGPGTPLRHRLLGALLLAYLASPVDLVPLWIPVLGLVDDLLIVPWGLSRVVGGLPEGARARAEARAARFIERCVRRPLVFFAVLLVALLVLWGLLLWLAWWWIAAR
jgi:uncharacterized membrane protein YkvA (DUF1232 family)